MLIPLEHDHIDRLRPRYLDRPIISCHIIILPYHIPKYIGYVYYIFSSLCPGKIIYLTKAQVV